MTTTRITPAAAAHLSRYDTLFGGIRSDSDADHLVEVLLREGANVADVTNTARQLALRSPRHKAAKRVLLGSARVQLQYALMADKRR